MRLRTPASLVIALAFVGLGAATGVAGAAELRPGASQDEIQRFCSNIADAARDRRYALQAKKLNALKDDVNERIAALEKKRAEYENWLKRRDDFLEQAKTDLVDIYANMRPDAAAERLAQVSPALAAAIMLKLEPRKAGVILNEMETKAAATLTGIIADAAQKKDPS